MVHIHADTPDIQNILKDMTQIVQNNGGKLNEHIAITCEDGELSLEFDGPAKQNEKIIEIPDKLLIPIKHLHASLKDNQFAINPNTEKLSTAQISLAEHIITLYNYSGKAKWQRDNCPWITLRPYKDIIQLLFKGRSKSDLKDTHIAFLQQDKDAQEEDDFICDSFLRTRVIGHRQSSEDKAEQKIMPIVDFMNHHLDGCPFNFAADKDGTNMLYILNKQPLAHSREFFAFYNRLDAFDSYLSYYFIDQTPHFVRSIPTTLQIDDIGTIDIKTKAGVLKLNDLPEQLKDLRGFMPQLHKNKDGHMVISHLMITNHPSPHAMRRILRVLIGNLSGWTLSHNKLCKIIAKAERDIINQNIAYYKDLLQCIAQYQATDHQIALAPLKDLCNLQITKLYRYHFDDQFFGRQYGRDIATLNLNKETEKQIA